jgi:hypothetical protein
MPVLPIVATLALLLLQVPPVVASLKVVFKPTHALCTPVIGDIGLTVNIEVV